MTLPSPPQAQRKKARFEFRQYCQDIVKARPGGGYITCEAARLLKNALKVAVSDLPDGEWQQQDVKKLAREALAKVTSHRITMATLAPYVLLRVEDREDPDAVRVYRDAASGYEYAYRKFLTSRYKDGVLEVLVDWHPTWEPAANLRESDMVRFHAWQRDERRQRREEAQEEQKSEQ